MDKHRNDYATQIALFRSMSREKLEVSINNSLLEIATLGHKYSKIKMWTEDKSWHGILEYEMLLEELIGVTPDDNEEENKRLRNYRYNANHSILEVGYAGCKALILQNGLDIDISLDYNDVMRLICESTNLEKNTPINQMIIEVETVEVEIKID